ncbi:AraC family transcriptional regulator [Cohnella caldifontis]|uniref:AraC family transcriptional regulator n=1 Tax=Cohnella caldifontis TaxID=3027471 RepID=UPI0023ECAF4F|nr:AraC family transcriptional regulator [Cohnella sp. YIM B05605]
MPFVRRNHGENPLEFAYQRKSVNYEHRETFHSHLGIELLWIHQGKGTMIVNNTRYEIRPGMFCMFQPYQLHHLKLEYEDGQSFERSLAIFEPTMFESYFEPWPSLHSFYRFLSFGQLPYPCLYDIDGHPQLDSLFRGMNEQLPTLTGADMLEEISLFLVGLIRFLKAAWERLGPDAKAYHTRRKSRQVEPILSWIEAHYASPFRLEEMARSLHLSPYHLSHLFKEATGVSITEYMAARRIHQAVRLLTTTDKPVSWIAEAVGLTNASYFCKLFKSHMGIAPHQYRKKWAGP